MSDRTALIIFFVGWIVFALFFMIVSIIKKGEQLDREEVGFVIIFSMVWIGTVPLAIFIALARLVVRAGMVLNLLLAKFMKKYADK